MTNWFVYLIQSEARGTLYCGIAIDPDLRLRKHNGALKGGAKRTRAGRPWVLVHIEGPMTRSEALKREFVIKTLRRKDKLQLIETLLDARLSELSPQTFYCLSA